jgi:hypothetical protein
MHSRESGTQVSRRRTTWEYELGGIYPRRHSEQGRQHSWNTNSADYRVAPASELHYPEQ